MEMTYNQEIGLSYEAAITILKRTGGMNEDQAKTIMNDLTPMHHEIETNQFHYTRSQILQKLLDAQEAAQQEANLINERVTMYTRAIEGLFY
jgi:polyhydroxyalkanoate synthesis regulator phasin